MSVIDCIAVNEFFCFIIHHLNFRAIIKLSATLNYSEMRITYSYFSKWRVPAHHSPGGRLYHMDRLITEFAYQGDTCSSSFLEKNVGRRLSLRSASRYLRNKPEIEGRKVVVLPLGSGLVLFRRDMQTAAILLVRWQPCKCLCRWPSRSFPRGSDEKRARSL
jgi:hypothetical protein